MPKVEVRHISWDLNKSFNISRGSKKTAETIEVKIEDGQFCGYGECVPYNRYNETIESCLLYTSPSPRDLSTSRMPSSA